jgi:hypothetical protein
LNTDVSQPMLQFTLAKFAHNSNSGCTYLGFLGMGNTDINNLVCVAK